MIAGLFGVENEVIGIGLDVTRLLKLESIVGKSIGWIRGNADVSAVTKLWDGVIVG